MILTWIWDIRRDVTSGAGSSTYQLPITVEKPLFKAVETTTRIAVNGVAHGAGAEEFGWYRWKETGSDDVGFRILVIGY